MHATLKGFFFWWCAARLPSSKTMDAGEKKYHHEFAAVVEFVTDVLTS
jgi:hypothetical protein